MTTCFVAMPISTPNPALYHGDADHFQHVLEHLFVPAIEMAGMTPVRPKAEGADLIHAEIIKQLETADLVLCDISTLNANVFFELGIRTALNRPVCIVRDEHTQTIPFDTTMINHASYMSALPAWELQKQVSLLAEHLKTSLNRSNGENKLWKYFGLTMSGTPAIEGKDAVGDRLALMSSQIEALTMQMAHRPIQPPVVSSSRHFRSKSEEFSGVLQRLAEGVADRFDNMVISSTFSSAGELSIHLMHEASEGLIRSLKELAIKIGAAYLEIKTPNGTVTEIL